jgi:hypothetical protein
MTDQPSLDDEDDNKMGKAMVCMNGYMGGESSGSEDEVESNTDE